MQFRGITPFCDSLDCTSCTFDYKDEPIGISGPGGEGTSKYCLLVTRLSSSYYKIVPAGDEGNPMVGYSNVKAYLDSIGKKQYFICRSASAS